MLNQPHSCHEHCGKATQHLVLFILITNTTTLFIGHMRMNEYNYTHSRSHACVVGATCIGFDNLPKIVQ